MPGRRVATEWDLIKEFECSFLAWGDPLALFLFMLLQWERARELIHSNAESLAGSP